MAAVDPADLNLVLLAGAGLLLVAVAAVRVSTRAGLPSLLVYLAIGLSVALWWWLYRTDAGMRLRSVGENPKAADSLGIDVTRTDPVVALPAVFLVARRPIIAVERPHVRELAVAPVPGSQDAARVVPAAHDEAGPPPVEIGDAGQEPIAAVAAVIAPRRHVATRRNVVGSRQGGA